MRVQLNDQLTTELLDELMHDIEEDRSGQHPSVTDLISCLTKSYYNIHHGRIEHTTKTKIFFVVGLGLERALLAFRKEEMLVGQYDGIWYHVDSRDKGLVEMKSTRASKKKHLEGDFPESWILQMKSYCKALGELAVDLVVIYIIQADIQTYRLTFTQEEIDEHWEWMKGRRDILSKAIEKSEAPTAYMYNQDWECKDCQYAIVCEQRTKYGV